MSLIDRTYFDGSLILSGVNAQYTQEAIDAAIAEYEPEYLQRLLGPSLYAAFKAGLLSGTGSYFSEEFSDEFVKSPYDDRWHWIIDGHTYTANGQTFTWKGLVSPYGLPKKSPIAQYVYFRYRCDNVTNPASTGAETSPKFENSTPASPKRKLIEVWNRMVEYNWGLIHMLANLYDDDGLIVYPEPEVQELDWELFEPIPKVL